MYMQIVFWKKSVDFDCIQSVSLGTRGLQHTLLHAPSPRSTLRPILLSMWRQAYPTVSRHPGDDRSFGSTAQTEEKKAWQTELDKRTLQRRSLFLFREIWNSQTYSTINKIYPKTIGKSSFLLSATFPATTLSRPVRHRVHAPRGPSSQGRELLNIPHPEFKTFLTFHWSLYEHLYLRIFHLEYIML